MADRQQGVIYACVCQGTQTKAEAGSVASKVTLKAFIDGTVSGPFASKDKASFNHDVCSYNYIKAASGFTFIAVAPKEVDTRIVYEFLGEMVKEFDTHGSDRESYEQKLKILLAEYADPKDQIQQTQESLNKTKVTMQDNLVKMMDKGIVLEQAEERAIDMESKASEFKTKATEVKKCAKWKRLRMRILLCFCVLVIIFIVLIACCGGFSFPKCGGDSSTVKIGDINVHFPPMAAPPPVAAAPV